MSWENIIKIDQWAQPTIGPKGFLIREGNELVAYIGKPTAKGHEIGRGAESDWEQLLHIIGLGKYSHVDPQWDSRLGRIVR